MLAYTLNTHNPNLAGLQQPANNQQSERNNQRSGSFNNSNSLTGDSKTDKVLLSLVLAMVQLLLQQLGEGGGQQSQDDEGDNSGKNNSGSGHQNNNSTADTGDLTDTFTSRDKNLLLNAIGASSGTRINRIDDANSSGNLNGGDKLFLQANGGSGNHTVTNEEVSNFIEQRNPADTPKLTINAQQTATLKNLHSFDSVEIADVNGDNRISVGDFATGDKFQDFETVRLDVPVDPELLAQLKQ